MPRTPEEHLKANYGVALVMEKFSAGCLVRPVAAGTDVGVDLYCESVAEGKPFLHFWVQVKLCTNLAWSFYDFAHGLPAQGALMCVYAGLAVYGFVAWGRRQ
jgi:hypothetical protein